MKQVPDDGPHLTRRQLLKGGTAATALSVVLTGSVSATDLPIAKIVAPPAPRPAPESARKAQQPLAPIDVNTDDFVALAKALTGLPHLDAEWAEEYLARAKRYSAVASDLIELVRTDKAIRASGLNEVGEIEAKIMVPGSKLKAVAEQIIYL